MKTERCLVDILTLLGCQVLELPTNLSLTIIVFGSL